MGWGSSKGGIGGSGVGWSGSGNSSRSQAAHNGANVGRSSGGSSSSSRNSSGSSSSGSNNSGNSNAGRSADSGGRRGSALGSFGSMVNSALGALGFGSPDKGGIDGTGISWSGSGAESRADAAYGQVEQGLQARSNVNAARSVPAIGGLLSVAGDLAAKSMTPTAQRAYSGMKDKGVNPTIGAIAGTLGQTLTGAPMHSVVSMVDAGMEQNYANNLMGREQDTGNRRSSASSSFTSNDSGRPASAPLATNNQAAPALAVPDYDSWSYGSHLNNFRTA